MTLVQIVETHLLTCIAVSEGNPDKDTRAGEEPH